jgi:transcriptional regulator with XRE-family HTH domain
MHALGRKLKRLRMARGLSQDELAEQLNVAYDTAFNKGMISKWENNIGEPRLETARILASFFQITIDELSRPDVDDEGEEQGELREQELTDARILTLAAHRVGYEGELNADQLAKIKLAMKIALASDTKS